MPSKLHFSRPVTLMANKKIWKIFAGNNRSYLIWEALQTAAA